MSNVTAPNPAASAESTLRISVDQHTSGAAEYARDKIGRALAHASEPVLSAHVRLSRHRAAALAKPVVAQVNVNMAGRGVRAQVAAGSAREAVDLLAARLAARLERLARHWEAVRGGRPAAGAPAWRRGTAPRPGLPYFPRPVDERQVLRHKSFALAEETCDEAAFDMELMDYHFHLFTESGSGIDSVLYRTDSGYRLAQAIPRPELIARGALEYTVSAAAAPELDIAAATERLELTGRPFVFFRDSELHRGCVLYHRYDGHYGLITPVS
jgi:hypothetical protein